jgi:hypothetical protein
MAKTYKVELELTADELDYIEDVWYYDSRDQKTLEQILKYKVYYAIGEYIK